MKDPGLKILLAKVSYVPKTLIVSHLVLSDIIMKVFLPLYCN